LCKAIGNGIVILKQKQKALVCQRRRKQRRCVFARTL
jgi:hypothetical protein